MSDILMLSWEYPPHVVGGLARHVDALSRHLAMKGHRVYVLTRWTQGLPEVSAQDGVHVVRVKPYFHEPADFRLWVTHLNFALVEAGVRLCEQIGRPCLLHAHDWLVAYAAKSLKSLFRVPLIATIHATEHGRQRGIHDSGQQYINDVEWWLTYEAWRVIVCSEAMRAEVCRLFDLANDKVVVIPNGVEVASRHETTPPGGHLAFAEPGERLMVLVGRLVPEKGAAVAIEALRRLIGRHRLKLIVAGTGPYRAEVEQQVRDLGLERSVRFLGWVDDQVATNLFRNADVVLVPSLYEPFGIVALEAMANMAPLVVSDVGGLREIVTEGVNGLKAQPGDAAVLARQIDRVLSSADLAARLKRNAYRHVTACYSWHAIAETTAGVYERVVGAHRDAPWGEPHHSLAQPPGAGPLPGRYTT